MSDLMKLLEKKTAAVVVRQPLKPVEGDNAVIFPPTFADVGYNIDKIINANGEVSNVCLIDSVGSQANRMEPIFLEEPYASLIPSVVVKTEKTNQTVNVLEAGHRLADAIVRFSDLADDIESIFQAAKSGDTQPMAKLAPTSLVFGCWDSRESGAKLPRIVRSTIRAYGVSDLHRSAQYVPAIENYDEEFDKLTEKEKKAFSEVGMSHVPAPHALGGVQLSEGSQLYREGVLSLAALRRLQVPGNPEQTKKLQAYILGLSLIALTQSMDSFLRMGCELTPDPKSPAIWETVAADGTRSKFTVDTDDIFAFAKKAADEFGVGENKNGTFDKSKAKAALNKKDKGQDA